MKKFVMLLVFAAVVIFAGCSSDDGFSYDREITVVSREDGSGTRGAFIEILGIEVSGADGSTIDMTTPNAETVNSTSIVVTTVANDMYAIGYISLGSLNDSVKAINVDGVAANSANILNRTYPLFREFLIATRQGDVSELSLDFISFMLSAEGQAIAGGNYVPVDTAAQPYTATAGLSGRIVVSGSTSVGPLMERMREAYIELNPDVVVEVQQGGSSTGLTATINGTADIAMSSRNLRPAELEVLEAATIAFDGLAVIINNENTITNLAREQIRQVFVGDVTMWNELNG